MIDWVSEWVIEWLIGWRDFLILGQGPPILDPISLRLQVRSFNYNMQQRTAQLKSEGKQQHLLKRSTTAKLTAASDQPIGNLKKIAYTDLRLNIQAEGKFLVLRTLESPSRAVAVQVISQMGIFVVVQSANQSIDRSSISSINQSINISIDGISQWKIGVIKSTQLGQVY